MDGMGGVVAVILAVGLALRPFQRKLTPEEERQNREDMAIW